MGARRFITFSPYSSLREHQSRILSRRDFKGTLAPPYSFWWFFRGAHDLYFVRKTLLALRARAGGLFGD
jgi:hypothetical protein